jgi:hypothetical protein
MRCVRKKLKPRVADKRLDYRHFMMELADIGMLKCPVNINFAKVIVLIKKTVFVTQPLWFG